MQKLVVLSGAGISAESGIKTFRDSDGLWEGHDVMEVASPQGWAANPELVLDFYNQRRRQLFEVKPNAAHSIISDLQAHFEVAVVTQNVDDLHERSGSKNVLHLHGKLRSVRSEQNPQLKRYWEGDLHLGDVAEDQAQLRPDIVWFGEDVPLMAEAINLVMAAKVVLIIGTSLQVYPAAGLINYAAQDALLYYLDPKAKHLKLPSRINCLSETAVSGMQNLLPTLIALAN